ncbi:hypothetical protein [Coleofasciculus sp.]|uniref:hypothetical protein n=1 Tax=Coleofasciculus sp. TaxID=3100458 RepID=UPI003A406166
MNLKPKTKQKKAEGKRPLLTFRSSHYPPPTPPPFTLPWDLQKCDCAVWVVDYGQMRSRHCYVLLTLAIGWRVFLTVGW